MKDQYVSVSISVKIFFLLFSISAESVYGWTQLYQQTYCPKKQKQNRQKQEILFSQSNIASFTQLLVSWNAQKPVLGYFTFYAQVRDTNTKKWGKWHRMYQWGNDKQHSYYSKSDGVSTHHYVRLEADENKKLDGFRIKVIPHNADLGLMTALFANASDLQEFSSELSTVKKSSFASVHVAHVGKIPQLSLSHKDAARICSPASCAMIHQFISGKNYSIDSFANAVFDKGLEVYGSWPFNVSHLFEVLNGFAYTWVQRFDSFSDLHKQLLENIPVVVSVRGTLPGALKNFPHGHLLVVVGFDARTNEVICHDPACYTVHQVEKKYSLSHFIVAWENSRRLGYCISPIKNKEL